MAEKLNYIGLNAEKSKALAEKLNTLLANYSVLYVNARGFHWNLKGDTFFELHLKFQELYDDVLLKIDDIAERIATLGYQPMHSYSDYLKHSKIKESTNVTDGPKALQLVLDSLQVLLTLQRELLDLSADAGDEGTNSLMSGYISQQEKLAWMYASYLGK